MVNVLQMLKCLLLKNQTFKANLLITRQVCLFINRQKSVENVPRMIQYLSRMHLHHVMTFIHPEIDF